MMKPENEKDLAPLQISLNLKHMQIILANHMVKMIIQSFVCELQDLDEARSEQMADHFNQLIYACTVINEQSLSSNSSATLESNKSVHYTNSFASHI